MPGTQRTGRQSWSLRGEASGAPLVVEAWILVEFDQARISKMAYFLDEEAARSAAAELG